MRCAPWLRWLCMPILILNCVWPPLPTGYSSGLKRQVGGETTPYLITDGLETICASKCALAVEWLTHETGLLLKSCTCSAG